jgi:hypothetical protein
MDWSPEDLVFPALLFMAISSLGFAVCNGCYVSEIDNSFEGTLARKLPGPAKVRYNSAMSLTVFASLTAVCCVLEAVILLDLVPKVVPMPDIAILVALILTPVFFLACIFAIGFLLASLHDPLPPVFSVLEDRNYYENAEVRSYVDGFFAAGSSRGIKGLATPRRQIRKFEASTVDGVKAECLGRYLKDSTLTVPPYPVAAGDWPLAHPFRLGSRTGDGSDILAHLESGDSGDENDDGRYLFETADFPVCRGITWNPKSAVADLDACEIEVKDGTCAPGWDAGDLESWICTGFKACVREGKRHVKEVEKRPERLEDLGAVQEMVGIDGEEVLAWVLPKGWEKAGDAQSYYRKAVSREADTALRIHPLRLYAFNVCFLVIGAVGWVTLLVATAFFLLG